MTDLSGRTPIPFHQVGPLSNNYIESILKIIDYPIFGSESPLFIFILPDHNKNCLETLHQKH